MKKIPFLYPVASCILCLLVIICLAAQSVKAQDHLIGIVLYNNNMQIFAIQNKTLKNKTKITVYSKKKIITGEIKSKLKNDENLNSLVTFFNSDEETSFYHLKISNTDETNEGIGYLMIRGNPSPDSEIITLLENKNFSNYKSCLSQEGIHYNIWSDEPCKSKKIWHGYRYLGYDVEPTCDKSDSEE